MAVEGLHCGGVGGIDVVAPEHLFESCQHYAAVGEERDMVDIPDVELEFLMPADGVAAVTLRPAGDAGAYFVASGLLCRVEGEVFHQEWTRADERHVAFEDIPELGELVDGCGADEASHLCQSLSVGEQVSVGVPLVGHGLELDHSEDASILAGALLTEEGAGTLVGEVEPYGDSDQGD